MNNSSPCCTVALITKCNHATVTHDNATHHETTTQPPGLLSLAIKVLERNKSNATRNHPATSQLHHTETYATKKFADTELHREATNKSLTTTGQSQESCMVAFPIGRNHATELICSQCGYLKSLCECTPGCNPQIVTCNGCEHFIPDKIGDGAGIGGCGLGIKWTQEYNGRKPLFRYAERHCNDFSKLMS